MRRIAIILAFCSAIVTATTAHSFATEQNQEQRKLFVEGATLWPIYCAQCHNARPGSQFSPAQWNTITMHMRTQSIMPAKDMRAIKEFLQEAR